MTSLNQDMALKLLKNFLNLVFIKNLWNFWVVLKPCLDLMMSFKNCIRVRIASFCHPAYYFWRLRRCQTSVNRPCAIGGVDITDGQFGTEKDQIFYIVAQGFLRYSLLAEFPRLHEAVLKILRVIRILNYMLLIISGPRK